MQDMWQPSSVDKSYRYFEENESIELLYEMDKDFNEVKGKMDNKNILKYNIKPKQINTTQVINLIVPSGV